MKCDLRVTSEWSRQTLFHCHTMAWGGLKFSDLLDASPDRLALEGFSLPTPQPQPELEHMLDRHTQSIQTDWEGELPGINMSGKGRACSACQRNGRLTCRRCSRNRRLEGTSPCMSVLKPVPCLTFQDPAGGAVSEDVPSAVCRSSKEDERVLSGWTHAQGELQTGSAGGGGAPAGRT